MSAIFRKARLFPLLASLLLGLPAAPLVAQVSGARPAEYMIYQYPDVDLVVVIDAEEAEFEVEIMGPEKALLKEAGIEGRRLGPVYQYVDAAGSARQLMIKVNPGRRIDRSRISMELLQMTGGDRYAAAQARAYKLLSYGMERSYAADTTTWASRAYSLGNAARAFAELGMEEMRLWAEYYSAHVVLHQLNDYLPALERAREIRQAAVRAGFERIELVALILEGDALMRAGENAEGKAAFARFESAHATWQRVAELAGRQGLAGEHGRALFNDGLAFERQQRLDRAIERYREALDAAAGAGDQELLNRIRAVAAATYETQGSTVGAIGMLDGISSDLSEDSEADASLDLAANLFEKGRLLNSTYRFEEAALELSAALQLQTEARASVARGRTGLELGWSLYSQGFLEQAEELIGQSLPRSPDAPPEMLGRAFGALAAIHRLAGRFDEMSESRLRQAEQVVGHGQAAVLLEKALDAIARGGHGSATAPGLLRQAEQAARAEGDLDTAHRAVLQQCLAGLLREGAAACATEQARAAFRDLVKSGVPALSAEAAFTWARILHHRGEGADARKEMSRLVEDLHFYRHGLSGVLGAWYWINRADVAAEFARMARGAGGADLLLALERIRRLEASRGDQGSHEVLRGDIALLEDSKGAGDAALTRRVNAELDALRNTENPPWRAPGRRDLDRWLSRLGDSETVLAFHFDADGAYALPAGRNGVGLVRYAGADRIRQNLDSLREQLGSMGAAAPLPTLDMLGAALLGPLEGQLGRRVYLLPSGPLNGLPFDALRNDGEFLAASHQVILIGSLASLGSTPGLPAGFARNVFLAGNPQSGQDLFSYGITTSTEISAVRDRFVGEGLHIVQGVALRRDEFLDERFSRAGLVHLAMPGRIDLARPEHSRLLLSATGEAAAGEYLGAADVRKFRLSAALVVLSGTAFAEVSASPMDSRIGLVSDFHAAGVHRVIAALWPPGDRESAAFLTDFYTALETLGEVESALFETRKKRLNAGNDGNFGSWAGFQLFIR